MDITGVYENSDMMGGKVLFELELEEHETDILDANYLGYAFTEPYDSNHLWFWSQVNLDDTLMDAAFWNSISRGIADINGGEGPDADELIQMVEDRLAEGNTEDFEQRLG